MRRAFEDWLKGECDRHPLLLVLDDLHWGDAGTVAFLDAALRNLRDCSLLVLALGAARAARHASPICGPAAGPCRSIWARCRRRRPRSWCARRWAPRRRPRVWRPSSPAPTATRFIWKSWCGPRAKGAPMGCPTRSWAWCTPVSTPRATWPSRSCGRPASSASASRGSGLAALLGGEAELPHLNEWVDRLAARELDQPERRGPGLGGRAVLLPRADPRRGLRDLDRGGQRARPPARRRLPRAGGMPRRHGAGRSTSAGATSRRGPCAGTGRRPSRRCARATCRAPSAGPRSAWPPSPRSTAAQRAEVAADAVGALRLAQAEAHLWRAEFAQAVARGTEATGAPWSRARPSGSARWGRRSSAWPSRARSTSWCALTRRRARRPSATPKRATPRWSAWPGR